MSKDDRLRAYVIERLMCDERVDLADAGRRFGAPRTWADDALVLLDEMVVDGIIEHQGYTLRMTEFGRPLVRLVAAAFDIYRQTAAARHSVAI